MKGPLYTPLFMLTDPLVPGRGEFLERLAQPLRRQQVPIRQMKNPPYRVSVVCLKPYRWKNPEPWTLDFRHFQEILRGD